jgi:trk system potassium uptake protein TrkA
MVEEEVTVGDLVRLLPLERGGISIVEMTVPANSPNAGRPLYELRLPPDAAIVAIIRDRHVVIPQPETVITDGDEVLALSVPDAEAELRAAVVGDAATGIAATGETRGARITR